jgi:hypothetical protein
VVRLLQVSVDYRSTKRNVGLTIEDVLHVQVLKLVVAIHDIRSKVEGIAFVI